MRLIRRIALALVATATLAGAPQLSAQVTVDTYAGWNGSDYYFPFGAPTSSSTDAYGQVFQAPAQYLNSWSYWLRDYSGGNGLLFTANIATWTGSAIGSLLWTSGSFAGTNSASWQQYNFNTGGVSLLTGGQSYIFFLDALSGTGAMQVAARYDSPYAGGNFSYNNGTVHTNNWDGLTASDLTFTASFDRVPGSGEEVVPEPATMTLLATGLMGLAGAARRKRRSA